MTPAARPYAEALHSLATERGQAAAVLGELEVVKEALAREPAAAELLLHPEIRPAAAAGLLSRLCERLSPTVGAFVRLLADRRRLGVLGPIIDSLRERLDEAEGRVRARLQTARAIDSAMLDKLRGALGRRLSAEVVVRPELRPELVGGALVIVGDRVLDASLAGRLAALRRRLMAARD